MRKWFCSLKGRWKLVAVLTAVALWANTGYWTHAWAVKAIDPGAFGHKFWYGYWPVDVTPGHAMEIAVYELLWPLILAFTAGVWLGATAAILFWKLAFQGELFRLIAAFLRWDGWFPVMMVSVLVIVIAVWGLGSGTKKTRQRPKDERLPGRGPGGIIG